MSEILNAPHPILSKIAEPVTNFDNKLETLIQNMSKALESARDPVGVGLAAPQIGESKRIFVTKPGIKHKLEVFINPKITSFEQLEKRKKKRIRKLEGCLSLQGIWGEVERYPKITLEYQNDKGQRFTKSFTGFLSTIIQHEVDHLEGILFPKRVLEQKGKLYESKKDAKGHDYFEELTI
ncbi:MAG: peptide deformylase [Candidatus Levybacteria bacterium RIFCSPLOWO2_01_FULL_36_13]|nr:MAG: peptide deformylase [Candidatus Levybacteria bacterium RIFCSPHIGHO2_01_FULL_36_15b]OGH35170.1 MAG: peptide deformylase [Candidatus Levybacteria bacterium RIFCSPLOWO2_01_FULL_36_13]